MVAMTRGVPGSVHLPCRLLELFWGPRVGGNPQRPEARGVGVLRGAATRAREDTRPVPLRRDGPAGQRNLRCNTETKQARCAADWAQMSGQRRLRQPLAGVSSPWQARPWALVPDSMRAALGKKRTPALCQRAQIAPCPPAG